MTKRMTVGEWLFEHGPEVVAWAPNFAGITVCWVMRPALWRTLLELLGILLGALALRFYVPHRMRRVAEKLAQADASPTGSTFEPEATPTLAPTLPTQRRAAATVASAVPMLIDFTSRRVIKAPTCSPPHDEWKELNRWMFRTTKDEWRGRFDEILATDPPASRATLRRLLADELRALELPYRAYVTEIDLPRLALLAGATSDRHLWRRLVRYLKEKDEAHRIGQRLSGTSKADLGPHASDERAARWVRSEANYVTLPERAWARIDAVLKKYEEEFVAGRFDDGE